MQPSSQRPKVVVVMPAYNAAQTLERTVAEVPALVDEIILVDDRSKDNTAEIARRLGISEMTARRHISLLLPRLGLTDRAGAVELMRGRSLE
jgi:glycosyltransferase involved in cell wall biosynthesis